MPRTDDRHVGQVYEVTGPRLITFAGAAGNVLIVYAIHEDASGVGCQVGAFLGLDERDRGAGAACAADGAYGSDRSNPARRTRASGWSTGVKVKTSWFSMPS